MDDWQLVARRHVLQTDDDMPLQHIEEIDYANALGWDADEPDWVRAEFYSVALRRQLEAPM